MLEEEIKIRQENLFLRRLKEGVIPSLKYKRFIRSEYGKDYHETRNYKYVKEFYNMKKKDEYVIDDETWNDFDMDKVLKSMDKTYSSLGQSVLYSILRNPVFDENKLKDRDKIINFFRLNEKVRTNIQYRFLMLGRDKNNSLLEMLNSKLSQNKLKYYFYTFMGKVLPIILILLTIYNKSFGPSLMFLMMGNLYIFEREKYKINSKGVCYLRDVIDTSKKLSHIKNKNLESYTEKIKAINKKLKIIDGKTKVIKFINMWGRTFEFVSVLFLLEETTYYKIAPLLKENKEDILNLYEALGEMEALIAISSFKINLKDNCTTPIFTEDLSLEITDGSHILLKNGVSNSITINNKGIILTGTNMSGKSTFLRMVGVNIILAQSLYFVLAKRYTAPFLNVVSSIAPNDDLESGKSFYLAEAKSLLRVINALNKKIPVFCPIDEIFRGTNPVERIAASGEILKYINKQNNSISIVSTHDRELVEILKENFEFYHFSESVKDNALTFDYKIKKGVSHTRNAIKLLEVIGYNKEIVENSYIKAREIDEKIGLKNI